MTPPPKNPPARWLQLLFAALLALALAPVEAMAKPAKTQARHAAVKPGKAKLRLAAPRKPAAFGAAAEVSAFVAEMQARHGFDPTQLHRFFASIERNDAALRAIAPAATPELQRSWERYRMRFVNRQRIDAGLRFWQENDDLLRRAEADYGVPPEIVTALIGVETAYGANTGRFGVFEVLATLAFHYPPRAPFFRDELEALLLFARERGIDPLSLRGSFAGASGIAQFMPSSLRRFAVDYDGDSRIDLEHSRADAIGSVARYLAAHGWQSGAPVTLPARVDGDPGALLAAGMKPSVPVGELARQGVLTAAEVEPERQAALIRLSSPEADDEYWATFDNFWVITRYNRSSFYAMAVFQLAQALRTGEEQR
ncbi:lytic murein transglycosylase B [Rhodocyclus purpureus]|uniref:lytic murein transglycosylase B n=1 Tax=Rhodocyclus purpureus TaxID=1067 RepID=UPI001F5D1F96|nr:lytic murein transglycosylase B [Rhodocyclus purpureus]